MTEKRRTIGLKVKAIIMLVVAGLGFTKCTDEGILTKSTTTSTIATKLASVASDCSICKYVVPENTNTIDGAKLGLKPGDVICLSAAKKYSGTPLRFINIVGSSSSPIIVTTCGGTVSVTVPNTLTYVMKFEKSKYFKLTGGTVDGTYGIKLSGSNTLGLSLDNLTTNFEVDHVEVSNVGFAGIMAKTDPTCDDATIRGHFTLRDASIHHNYVHDTGGEGLYIGNSFYSNGVSTSCGIRYPHELENIKIYSNTVRNSGWESIQLGCAVRGAEVHDNVVENYGTKNINSQNNGIQIGEGSGGLCYNNYVKSGKGNGIIVLGIGDNVVFNNIIVNPGIAGIFCDDRYTTGTGFKFMNNTIVNPVGDGIRLYADLASLSNVVMNNLISNPGSFNTYETDNTPRTGQNDAYLYLLSKNVKVSQSNNFYTRNTSLANYLNLGSFSTTLTSVCSIVDKGANTSSSGVKFDFALKARPAGGVFDIGAVEYK